MLPSSTGLRSNDQQWELPVWRLCNRTPAAGICQQVNCCFFLGEERKIRWIPFAFLRSCVCVNRLRSMLDQGGAVKNFVDALQQLTNPEMIFKVTLNVQLWINGVATYSFCFFVIDYCHLFPHRIGGMVWRMNWTNQALTRNKWATCMKRCTLHLGTVTQTVMECSARNLSKFVDFLNLFIICLAKLIIGTLHSFHKTSNGKSAGYQLII